MLVSFMAAFMQDTLLEPFGGKVFGMSVGETTRFQAYWGTMAILSSFGALWAFRHRVSATYQRLSRWGVWLLILTFGVLALTALTEREALLRPALLLLGVGYGLWNIGTVGLMVVYSRESNAGLDLGVWTVVATLCRGGGVFAGALLYDFLRASTGEVATAFGLVFALEAALLVLSLPLLANIQDEARPAPCPAEKSEGELVLGASLD
jgi:BCD family chlorophyll transporter-like MFS transporter